MLLLKNAVSSCCRLMIVKEYSGPFTSKLSINPGPVMHQLVLASVRTARALRALTKRSTFIQYLILLGVEVHNERKKGGCIDQD